MNEVNLSYTPEIKMLYIKPTFVQKKNKPHLVYQQYCTL